jgi:integrase
MRALPAEAGRPRTACLPVLRPMSATESKARRTYGTGSLLVRTQADGQEVWYGRWYVGSRRTQRRIGPKLRRGTGRGLNRTQAETELRRMMVRERPPSTGADVPFAAAAELMLEDLEAIGRKPTTLENYRSILRTHLLPSLGNVPVSRVTTGEVEAIARRMLQDGKAARTRASSLKLLSQVFKFARYRRWCDDNPCQSVRKPKVQESADIRFLDRMELEALLAAVDISKKPFGATDRTIFLTAAMTGMRQGELLALRWRDVDWRAQKIRVRRNYVRGYWGTPKSRSGERSVPLATRVATELKRHFERSRFCAEDDLVFPHPETGAVLAHGSLLERLRSPLRAAGVRPIRFHDLRHTFGTRMAAAGVPMRSLQEWMGHRDYRTTLIYADYEPSEGESNLIDGAFS